MFREILSLCIGLMLVAFGVISVITEELSLYMIPITLLMFVGGGYLSYKGFMGLIRAMGGSGIRVPVREDDPVYAEKIGHICPNCGNEMKVDEKFCGKCGHKLF